MKIYILTDNVEALEVALNYIKNVEDKELVVLRDLDPDLLSRDEPSILILEEKKMKSSLKDYLKKNIKVLVVSEIQLDFGVEYYVSLEMGYGSNLINSI